MYEYVEGYELYGKLKNYPEVYLEAMKIYNPAMRWHYVNKFHNNLEPGLSINISDKLLCALGMQDEREQLLQCNASFGIRMTRAEFVGIMENHIYNRLIAQDFKDLENEGIVSHLKEYEKINISETSLKEFYIDKYNKWKYKQDGRIRDIVKNRVKEKKQNSRWLKNY